MSDHIVESLGAYLDGELQGRQLIDLEAHLLECQACRAEQRALQNLSQSLRDAPIPDFPTPDRFAAQVALQLPRKPAPSSHRKAFELGWWLFPVGLVIAWIFISTTLLVSNLVVTVTEIGGVSNASAWLIPSSASISTYSSALGQLGILENSSLQWAELTEGFTRAALPKLFWQSSIALLYLCWIAIWWTRHSHRGADYALEG